jgi:DNA-binding MarR family transcriptional regulator
MITDEQYRRLLEFRVQLRRFDQWSREAASEHGLTHVQHQLLVAIRGHAGDEGPTIGDCAAYLLVKSHTASELADRTAELGLVHRVGDPTDQRVVRLELTAKGREVVDALSEVHLEEFRRLAPLLGQL